MVAGLVEGLVEAFLGSFSDMVVCGFRVRTLLHHHMQYSILERPFVPGWPTFTHTRAPPHMQPCTVSQVCSTHMYNPTHAQ